MGRGHGIPSRKLLTSTILSLEENFSFTNYAEYRQNQWTFNFPEKNMLHLVHRTAFSLITTSSVLLAAGGCGKSDREYRGSICHCHCQKPGERTRSSPQTFITTPAPPLTRSDSSLTQPSQPIYRLMLPLIKSNYSPYCFALCFHTFCFM